MDDLSILEFQVMTLIAKGKTNTEISTELNIPISYVSNIIGKIYDKF